MVRLFVGVLALACCREAVAALVLVPPALNPGDQYRLVFSTSTTIPASSTDIATYNSFVNTVAAGNSLLNGITWSAIASTPDDDARDNTGTNPSAHAGVPIYNLAGARLAISNADLWDGALENPVAVDENGNPTTADVWTGTGIFGQETFNVEGLGTSVVTAGKVTLSTSSWIRGATLSNTGQSLSIYAISQVLTVAVPEYSSFGMMGLCLVLAAGFRRFGSGRRATRPGS